MATEIRDFTVTVPAGTAISAGFTSPLTFPARVVTEIHVRVPPGPRGELGFAIGTGGLSIVPYGTGNWIVTDNEDLIYPLDDTITSGAWQLLAYNTGSFDHTIRIYFYCSLLPAAAGGSSLLPTGSLSDTGTSDTGTGSTTGSGSGSGTGITTPTPPVITPPSVSPPSVSPPLSLPPVFPQLPGSGPAVVVPVPNELLLAVSATGTVALLAGGGYWPLVVQDDVAGLSAAKVAGVEVSAAFDAALRSAAPRGAWGASYVSGAASE